MMDRSPALDEEAAASRLAALLEQAAGVEARLVEPLAAYGAHVLAENRAANLTGAKTPETLLDHLLDSLTVVPYVTGELVDIGSGAGFPAIPLALATGHHVVMIEAVGKKARFLRAAVARLGLDAEVLQGRAESLAARPELRGRFAAATVRAVSNAPTSLELTIPFLRIGGRAVLQRGAFDARERAAAADAALVLGAALVEEVPLGGDRRLIVAAKERETPSRFPRRTGVPEKRPLCLRA
jgi:16S rRNA (guanine527-N7)-methyltransferase